MNRNFSTSASSGLLPDSAFRVNYLPPNLRFASVDPTTKAQSGGALKVYAGGSTEPKVQYGYGLGVYKGGSQSNGKLGFGYMHGGSLSSVFKNIGNTVRTGVFNMAKPKLSNILQKSLSAKIGDTLGKSRIGGALGEVLKSKTVQKMGKTMLKGATDAVVSKAIDAMLRQNNQLLPTLKEADTQVLAATQEAKKDESVGNTASQRGGCKSKNGKCKKKVRKTKTRPARKESSGNDGYKKPQHSAVLRKAVKKKFNF